MKRSAMSDKGRGSVSTVVSLSPSGGEPETSCTRRSRATEARNLFERVLSRNGLHKVTAPLQ